jgi:hypothetical protein
MKKLWVALCRRAIDSLEHTETRLLRLQARRSDALITGATETAKAVGLQLKELADRAIFNAYSDLLLNRAEANE